MSNPRFLYTDLTTYNFVADEDPSGDFPVSNLATYDIHEYWKAHDASSTQYLYMDFGVASPRNFVVVDGANFGTLLVSGIILLQAADDMSFLSGLVDITDFEGAQNDIPYVHYYAQVSKRFYRFTFTDSLIEQPRIGNIFIDNYLEFTTPYDYPFVNNDAQYETVEGVALSGRTRACQIYSTRPTWELKFSLQDDTFRSNYQTFQSTVMGTCRPFYFVDVDDSANYVHLDTDYSPLISYRKGKNNLEKVVLRSKDTIE